MTGGKGLRVDSVINSLADAAVDVLLETLEDSRERQARVLKAYMERFIDAAVRKAGTSVMDKVAEQIKKEVRK